MTSTDIEHAKAVWDRTKNLLELNARDMAAVHTEFERIVEDNFLIGSEPRRTLSSLLMAIYLTRDEVDDDEEIAAAKAIEIQARLDGLARRAVEATESVLRMRAMERRARRR